MKRLSDLDYLKLNKWQAFWYKVALFFCAIPLFFKNIGLGIVNFFKKCGIGIRDEFVDIGTTFSRGNFAVKLSFFIFGFGNLYFLIPSLIVMVVSSLSFGMCIFALLGGYSKLFLL